MIQTGLFVNAAVFSSPQEADAAALVFKDRLELAQRYADFLASAGIERGLLGPREAPRLWERHLLNSAAIASLVVSRETAASDPANRLVDVGSGAGLPGLVVAIARADVRVDLVETMQRRVDFLNEAVQLLGLESQVRVHRGRAEELAIITAVGAARWVTARAVAPLDRLVKWCLPLLESGGALLALKGMTATDELATHAKSVKRLGGVNPRIELCDAGIGEPVPVIVIERRKERS